MAVQPEDVRLLANSGFRRLLESRLASHIGQNMMLYSLLILVVNETGSSIHSTLLVTALILPSIVIGIPAGGLADLMPVRPLLILGQAARAVLLVAMVFYVGDIWMIYLLVLAFSVISQLIGPAESVATKRLVGFGQLAGANSWLAFVSMFGQALGAVALAPFILKIFNTEVSLIVAATMYGVATASAMLVAGAGAPRGETAVKEASIVEAFTAGWTVLRTSRRAFLAMVYLTAVWTLAKALAVLAPAYTKDVLGIATENTVFVVAPAAIGALLALLVTPLLARAFDAVRLAAAGFILYVAGTGALGFVVLIRDYFVRNVELNVPFVAREVGVSSVDVVTMAMILAIPLGFGATMVTVAGKAVLNQEAPMGKQARVFATQTAVSDALSLIPLFVIGGVAEVVGVREVLLAASVVALVAVAYFTLSRRFGPQAQPATG